MMHDGLSTAVLQLSLHNMFPASNNIVCFRANIFIWGPNATFEQPHPSTFIILFVIGPFHQFH